jgi:predicted amidohydrolase
MRYDTFFRFFAGQVTDWAGRGNGVGVTVAADKVSDVGAALCLDTRTAIGARRFLAASIVEVFLTTGADLAESGQIALLPGEWVSAGVARRTPSAPARPPGGVAGTTRSGR